MKTFWTGSKPLTATGSAMLCLFLVSVAGLFVDPRIITGAPAWLKPAKFAISIAIYLFTLAWIFNYLTRWPRFVGLLGWVTVVAMIVEILVIDGQAFRGAASHFNTATPFDAALFHVMGIAIGLLWSASAGIAFALFRQRFENRVLGTALRLGMLLTVLGSASGGFMIRPTTKQIADTKASGTLTRAGAHTVGGDDGGTGLPGTGWSTQHGDLRVPHFLGLHGVQAIPLFAWLVIRKRIAESQGIRLVRFAAASYFAVYVLLLLQALRGESIAASTAFTLVAILSLLLANMAALAQAVRRTV